MIEIKSLRSMLVTPRTAQWGSMNLRRFRPQGWLF